MQGRSPNPRWLAADGWSTNPPQEQRHDRNQGKARYDENDLDLGIHVSLGLLLHPITNQLFRRADVEAAAGKHGADEIGEVARGLPKIVRFHLAEVVAGI